ncbi:NfeD family protein [Microbacterium aurum]
MAARVTSPFVDGRGYVRLDNGEQWTAEIPDTVAVPEPGSRVVVTAVRGATVEVAPAAVTPERSTD